jgi:hypothetical protein
VAFAAGRLFLFSFASAIRHGGASLRGAARAIFRTFIKVEKNRLTPMPSYLF